MRAFISYNYCYGFNEIHVASFGDAPNKIESAYIFKNLEIYFAIYQVLYEPSAGLDFSGTIRRTFSTSSSSMNVIEGARDTKARSASSIMATPLRKDNRDSYFDIDRPDEARNAAPIFVFSDDMALTRR